MSITIFYNQASIYYFLDEQYMLDREINTEKLTKTVSQG